MPPRRDNSHEINKLRSIVKFFPVQLQLQEIALKHALGFYNQQPATYKEELDDISRKFYTYINEIIRQHRYEYFAGIIISIVMAVIFGFTSFVGVKGNLKLLQFSGSMIAVALVALAYSLYKLINIKALHYDLEHNRPQLESTLEPKKILPELFASIEPFFEKHGFSALYRSIKENIS